MKCIKSLFGVLILAGGLTVDGYSQSFLTNGLVAYYPFDGNANDESGNGNDCTVSGAQLGTDRFGNISNSYSFTTYPQYIDTSSSVGFPVATNDFSISLWAALNFLTNDHQIVFCNASVNDSQLGVWPTEKWTPKFGPVAKLDFSGSAGHERTAEL